MNQNGKLLLGLFAGVVAGVGIGLLLAPEAGEKTRKKLKKASRNLANTLVEKAEEAVHAGNGRVSELQAKLRQFS